MSSVMEKKTNSKISNNLTSHLQVLDKEEKTKPKVSKRKEIVKIRVEIETKKKTQ